MKNNINNKCKVSVIIPVYNRAKTIADAIESVFAQTYTDYEIILVDDGSNDNFMKIVAQYGDRVTCIYQKNNGPAAARNNGIRHAKGEFIAFLDSDDSWLPIKLEKQLKCLEGDPRLGLIGTGYYNCDENLRNPIRQEIIKMANTEREEILIQNIRPTSSVVVRRVCFEVVGMFNEEMKFAEDWDMWIRIAQSFSIGTLDDSLVYMRKHTKSLSGSSANTDYNFGLWKKLILSNRKQLPEMNFVVYLKAMSFYYLNLSYTRRIAGDIRGGRWFLFMSLIHCPFFLARQFFRKQF